MGENHHKGCCCGQCEAQHANKTIGSQQAEIERLKSKLTEARCAGYDHISASLDRANGLIRGLQYSKNASEEVICNGCGAYDDEPCEAGCQIAAHLAGKPVEDKPTIDQKEVEDE